MLFRSYLAFAYNTSTHATTNCTPYEVMFRRQPKIPLDLICEQEIYIEDEADLLIEDQEQQVVNVYVEEQKTRLRDVFKQAEQSPDIRVEKSKIYHDRRER